MSWFNSALIASMITGALLYLAFNVSTAFGWVHSAADIIGGVTVGALMWLAIYRLGTREETDADDRAGWNEAHRQFCSKDH